MQVRNAKLIASSLVVLFTCFVAELSLAAEPGISVRGNVATFIKGEKVQKGNHLRFLVTHRKHGHIEIDLSAERRVEVPELVEGNIKRSASARILSGIVSSRRYASTTTVTGAIYKSRRSDAITVLHIPFQLRSRARNNPKMYDLEFQLFYNHKTKKIAHRLRAAASTPVEDEATECGHSHPKERAAAAPTARRMARAQAPGPWTGPSNRTISVYVFIDSRFYSVYGADSTSAVLIAMARSNEVFLKDMGIELQLAGVTTYADPAADPVAFPGTDSEGLLDAFTAFAKFQPTNGADLAYLATAERGFPDAVGYAWIQSVCSNDGYNAGWAEYDTRLEAFTHTLVHEIGHSAGSDHDLTDDPTSIMAITGEVDYVDLHFSDQSVSEMESHLANYNSCLWDNAYGSIGVPASAPEQDVSELAKNVRVSGRAKKRRGILKGKVSLKPRTPLPGRVVELIDYNTLEIIATTFTNARGRYSFRVPYSGRFYAEDRRSFKSTPYWYRLKGRR